MSQEKDFRRVNQALGKQPKIGPFPAGQILPLALILLLSYIAKQVFALSWVNAGLLAVWMMGVTWILTGTRAWRYFSKFVTVPYLTRTLLRYESLLVERGRGKGEK